MSLHPSQDIHWGGLTTQQRCSQCILQPQPTGPKVNRLALRTIIGKIESSAIFVNMLKLLNRGVKARVALSVRLSDEILIDNGDKQRDFLASPLLSIFVSVRVTNFSIRIQNNRVFSLRRINFKLKILHTLISEFL